MAKYEVELNGDDARLGSVAAVDVARLVLDVQTTIARAAGAATGKRPEGDRSVEGVAGGGGETSTRQGRARRCRRRNRSSRRPSRRRRALSLDVGSLAELGWSTAVDASNGVDNDAADPDVVVRLLAVVDDLTRG